MRATPVGCEMRSRFIANDMRVQPQPAHSVTSAISKVMTLPGINSLAELGDEPQQATKLYEAGPDMLYHCSQEMNHLASFLLHLYTEFAADSRL